MRSHPFPWVIAGSVEEYFQAFSKTLPIFVTCCQCLFHGANESRWLQLHSWLSDTIVVLMELLVCPALLNLLDPGRCAMCNPYKDIFCSYFLQLCLLYFSWSCTEVDVNDSKSELVQVMAWCHQATNHYRSQCWWDLCPHMASLGHNELIDPTRHHFVTELCTCIHISVTKMVYCGIFV